MKENNLNKEEGLILIKLARETLNSFIKENKKPDITKFKLSENLKTHTGVFVTLRINDNLRGCIGYIEGIKPLYEGVMDNTINAAIYDPRFTPVTGLEINEINIEISVMSKLTKIKSFNEIEVGTHGILLKKGVYSGLLLPQVAIEQGWNREQFLEGVGKKAGLPKNTWKNNCDIYIFSSQIINEG
jgi:AmmeMemoRadiSam system protein A